MSCILTSLLYTPTPSGDMVHSALSASQNSRLLCEHMESLEVATESAYEQTQRALVISMRITPAEKRQACPRSRGCSVPKLKTIKTVVDAL
ncbi:hypothetical protein R3P38DRAFT_3268019 [Favolaschia claudopus]|uniref:Uncharacterized protein n=1 Tax=Favolaschia claudopus TaxID=2862362 RepID=A0AAW0BK36_9AGAR